MEYVSRKDKTALASCKHVVLNLEVNGCQRPRDTLALLQYPLEYR